MILTAQIGDASVTLKDAAFQSNVYTVAQTSSDPATHKVAGVVLVDTTTTNTDVTALQADVGDASASTKGSIYGILGNPAANNHTVTLENIHDTDLPAVKTDTAAILVDTNELQTDWVNGGRLDLLIDSIITNVGTVDTVVDAIKAVTDLLTLAAIADAVHDEAVEGTTTLRKAIRLMNSVLFAKSSGGGTNTLVFQDIGDTKPRVTATVDAVGNRTGMVTDAT